MSVAHHHSEWLSLIEVSGPFLSMPVLMRVFPQGLDAHDSEKLRTLRLAYDEWEANQEAGPRTNPAIHGAWGRFVLATILGLPENTILEGQAIPQSIQASIPEHGEFLRPTIVIANPPTGTDAGKPRLLVQTYPASQDLEKPVAGKAWKASPGTRMMELLHATGVRLGLVTNGERWMLVDAPKGETTGFASWYASIWLEEPITLRAFTSLLGVERLFGVGPADTLEAMLAESAQNQQEVTDQLGYQVRRAVEVLIQSLDRADQDHDRHLLEGVDEKLMYEAALTVMMRLVFLFCAEERLLLPLDSDLYAKNYAVSKMREQLRKAADENDESVIERRTDAWCRLLSCFRLVFGGCDHPNLRMPAYGGHLFDPDRFPFFEGRKSGTTWKTCEADPLPVNNRTVLHLLEALQMLEVKMPGGEKAARRLSFRALDIEQIGHVYEGLLDHTAKRATEPMLGLAGTKDKEPEVALSKLEELAANGQDKLVEFLKEETGRSAKAIQNALAEELDLTSANRFQAICGNDKTLLKRIQPFAALVRDDTFGYPVVIPTGSVFVTAGTDRRSSGTHYTPRSLTEPTVQYTLEPLVYVGPAEGNPKEQWQLRSAKELLDLKICDMACGSGAFLVQACRYLSERLTEAWEKAEKRHPGTPGITPEGEASRGDAGETLIPKDADERMAYAKRLVAQRCLYGVDINPLASEMAKLSLWLLTLAKDKPFTFLDHTIRCGDSLLGIHDLKQLKTFSLDGTGQQYVFGQEPLDELVDKAIELRLKIESMPSNSVEHVEAQGRLMAEYEQRVEFLKCASDMLIAAELKGGTPREKLENRDHAAVQIGHYLKNGRHGEFRLAASKELGRRSLHWPLEFPEIVVRRTGFDAFVGNPPFMHGSWISSRFGDAYASLVRERYPAVVGKVDFVIYFLHRAAQLMRTNGILGLILTAKANQGDARKSGFQNLVGSGYHIFHACSDLPWPGDANVLVCMVHAYRGDWRGKEFDSHLRPIDAGHDGEVQPFPLLENEGTVYLGAKPDSLGFVLTAEQAEPLIRTPAMRSVVRGYFSGVDLNELAILSPPRFIIDFSECSLAQARQYPELLAIVEREVKPKRVTLKRAAYSERWWQFTEPQLTLFRSIRLHEQVIAVGRISKFFTFRFVPTCAVYSDKVVVFVRHTASDFAVLSSAIHVEWALEWGTTHGGGTPNYKPTESARTFPFPRFIEKHTVNTTPLGTALNDFRDGLMRHQQIGPTSLYNRFHDADDATKDIQKLRDLHVEMDKAVAAAYGWDDLKLGHDFHQTKQGTRFTISEPARREVLARLLKLNHERYAEEVAQGLHDKKKAAAGKKTRKVTTTGTDQMLF